LLLRFHAFGGRRHVEALGEARDRVDDRIRLGAIERS
jgi:hypothetical protein